MISDSLNLLVLPPTIVNNAATNSNTATIIRATQIYVLGIP